MATIPFAAPSSKAQVGQTGMPGNSPTNTVAMNYNFLPSVGTAKDVTANPYTANNYATSSTLNPFGQYTGFNLGLNSADELTKMYGPLGTALYYYLNQGAGYNPSVLTNLINQVQPQVQRDVATLGETAGMTGNRFGSAYQIGVGDYLSQVNANELAMASGLYQHSQDQIMQALQSVFGGAGQFQSNKGGFTSSLISALLPTLTGVGGDLLNLIPGINLPPMGGGGGGIGIPGSIGGIGGRGGGGGIGGGWGNINVGSGSNPYGLPPGVYNPTFPGSPQYGTPPIQTGATGATTGFDTSSTQGISIGGTGDLNSTTSLTNLLNLIYSVLPAGAGGGGPDVGTVGVDMPTELPNVN